MASFMCADINPAILFDTSALRKHRGRAAPHFHDYDFLFTAAAERLIDRLDDLTRYFPLAVDLGSHQGLLANILAAHPKIGTLISTADTEAMLAHAPAPCLIADDGLLPFAPESLDAILSVGSLHWVNDLPGMLAQAQRALKPDGLFLAIMPGATTLIELRESLAHSESQLYGGIHPRISPFLDIRDAGGLLQRAGFALPVVDSELLTVSYTDIFSLAKDLRNMGESSAMFARPKHIAPRALFAAAQAHYAAQHSDAEGRLTASIELLTLTAWKPAETQQKPLRRGSASHSLIDALQ